MRTVFFLVTDQDVYRSDQILEQLHEWMSAFRNGQWIRAQGADEESLEEYQAHLEHVVLENQKLAQGEDYTL